jgi:hypothetical protein
MKLEELEAFSTEQLVGEFIRTSKERGAAILDSDNRRANQMFDGMRAVDRVLRSRGKEARLALLPLLDDEDRFVRYFAASYMLGLAPDRARRIIEEIAKFKFDALCLEAGMCLYALDTGISKPD